MKMFLKSSLLALFMLSNSSFAGVLEKAGAKIVEEKDLGNIVQIVIEFPNGAKEIGYITKDNKYLLIGNVIDAQTGENITAKKYKELEKVEVSQIPLDEAIKLGNGSKKLIMIADPDCPFCKKAYQYLKSKNVELYIFLFPLDIHPNAYEKSVKILCSKDTAKAYDEVENGNQLQIDKCKEGEDKLKKHILIATKIGVRGTPVFIDVSTGYRIEGFNVSELEEVLK